MRGKVFALASLAAVLVLSAPVGAVTVKWDDLTDAQQEEAYNRLASENDALRAQLKALESAGGTNRRSGGESAGGTAGGSGTQAGSGMDASSGDQIASGQTAAGGTSVDAAGQTATGSANVSESQAAAGSALKDTDTFLKDLAASFSKRQQAAASVSQDQIAQMSEDEVWSYRFQCAEAERDFYNTYSGAQFSSLNVLYLCEEYCTGLGKQYQAEDVWKSSQDSDKTSKLYTAGYYNRAYALVEFHDYYGLELGDGFQTLKDAVAKVDAASGEEIRNAGVDAATVKNVQDMLNQLGFLCGQADGICGRQTVSCIERFQVMYGFEPQDGLIDDELISQMQGILARQGG